MEAIHLSQLTWELAMSALADVHKQEQEQQVVIVDLGLFPQEQE